MCIRFKTVSYQESYTLTQLRNASHNKIPVCPTITKRESFMALLMVKLNRHKTSLHLVTSVCLNFRQAIYKDKKNQTSTPSTATPNLK